MPSVRSMRAAYIRGRQNEVASYMKNKYEVSYKRNSKTRLHRDVTTHLWIAHSQSPRDLARIYSCSLPRPCIIRRMSISSFVPTENESKTKLWGTMGRGELNGFGVLWLAAWLGQPLGPTC